MIKISPKIILLCLSIILALLSIEVLLRIFPNLNRSGYASLAWNHWTSPADGGVDAALKSYTSAYNYDDEVGYVNAKVVEAIRKKEFDFKKTKYSVLVLGDSVSEDGRYVDYLKSKLRETYGRDNIEVLNAAVSGYDTKLEWAFLKTYGINYQPDLVILQFNVNDFTGTPVFIKNGNGSWLAFNNNNSIKSVNQKLFRYSKLYQYFVTSTLDRNQTIPDPYEVVKFPLVEMASFLADRQKDLAIVYFPKFEASEDTQEKHNLFRQITTDLQLSSQTLDLTPAYEGYDLQDISLDTTHPNERGDQIAEAKLFDFLQPIINAKIQPLISNREISCF